MLPRAVAIAREAVTPGTLKALTVPWLSLRLEEDLF
jgi:hypothetical protein